MGKNRSRAVRDQHQATRHVVRGKSVILTSVVCYSDSIEAGRKTRRERASSRVVLRSKRPFESRDSR
jgi:hypothetical protein